MYNLVAKATTLAEERAELVKAVLGHICDPRETIPVRLVRSISQENKYAQSGYKEAMEVTERLRTDYGLTEGEVSVIRASLFGSAMQLSIQLGHLAKSRRNITK